MLKKVKEIDEKASNDDGELIKKLKEKFEQNKVNDVRKSSTQFTSYY